MNATAPGEAESTGSEEEEASGREGLLDPEATSMEGDGSQPIGGEDPPPDSKDGFDQDDVGDAFGAAGAGVDDLLGGDHLGATEDALEDVEDLIGEPLGSAGGVVGGLVDGATGDIGEAASQEAEDLSGIGGLDGIIGGIVGGDADQVVEDTAKAFGDAVGEGLGIGRLDDMALYEITNRRAQEGSS